MAKEITKNEFRKNNSRKTSGHPTYIYAQIGKEYRFIGITHAQITDGIDNIPLEKNPEFGNKSKSYIRPYPEKAHRSTFGGKLKGWNFSDNDKEKIEKIKKHNSSQLEKWRN